MPIIGRRLVQPKKNRLVQSKQNTKTPVDAVDISVERAKETRMIALVDRVRDFDCQNSFAKLREHLNYYINLFSNKYKIAGCDADEIEQECLIALRSKAIEDFDPSRGRFKSFAVLCMKRHLFSLIKGNNQQKRKVLNTSISLDEDRSEGDNLSLSALIFTDEIPAIDQMVEQESAQLREIRFLSQLSEFEQEVYKLYAQQLSYNEIVDKLKAIFPTKKYKKKAIDNALQRAKLKGHSLSGKLDW